VQARDRVFQTVFRRLVGSVLDRIIVDNLPDAGYFELGKIFDSISISLRKMRQRRPFRDEINVRSYATSHAVCAHAKER